MEVIKLTVGQVASNVYILKKDHHVIIIDPGDEFFRIENEINEDDQVLAVILTHGHFDHIGAVNDVVNKYQCSVYANKAEAVVLNNPNISLYDGVIESEIHYFEHDFNIEDFKIKVHHTPGHTIGSVMFEIDDHLFTGDTLFDMSIGRMDLPTGSQSDMRKSIEYIKTIQSDYPIYPGHGPNSHLFKQFKANPYYK